MIWPILARYSIAFTAGIMWTHAPLVAKVLWVVLLLALVIHDLRDALRSTGEASR